MAVGVEIETVGRGEAITVSLTSARKARKPPKIHRNDERLHAIGTGGGLPEAERPGRDNEMRPEKVRLAARGPAYSLSCRVRMKKSGLGR